MLKRNIHTLERYLYVIAGGGILVWAFFWLGGIAQYLAFIPGALLLATGIFGYSFIYGFLHINTFLASRWQPSLLGVIVMLLSTLAILGGETYYSMVATRQKFFRDLLGVTNSLRQVRLATITQRKTASVDFYYTFVSRLDEFTVTYKTYHPYLILRDKKFNEDIEKIGSLVSNAKSNIDEGKLQDAHDILERAWPIFDQIMKRNNFSQLTLQLIDLKDAITKLSSAASRKDAQELLLVYSNANDTLDRVELYQKNDLTAALRKNLSQVPTLIGGEKKDGLPMLAKELDANMEKLFEKNTSDTFIINLFSL